MNHLTHIMLVEDEPDIREIACLSLESIGGYTMTACSSGQEALDTLATLKPHLILLDVMMPSMNGMTTLEKIRQMPACKDIPVIFMTARIQPSEIEQYIKLGAIGAIAKPFDPVTLASDIQKLWTDYARSQP